MINVNNPVQTRDGKPARIIETSAKGLRPLVALIEHNHSEQVRMYLRDGRFYSDGDDQLDLVNVATQMVPHCYECSQKMAIQVDAIELMNEQGISTYYHAQKVAPAMPYKIVDKIVQRFNDNKIPIGFSIYMNNTLIEFIAFSFVRRIYFGHTEKK